MLATVLILLVTLLTLGVAARSWAGTDPRRWIPDALASLTGIWSLGWLGTAANLWAGSEAMIAGQAPIHTVVPASLGPLQTSVAAILCLVAVFGALWWRARETDFRRPRGWVGSIAGASVLLCLSLFMAIGMSNFFGLYALTGQHISQSTDYASWVFTYTRGATLWAALTLAGSALLPALRLAWRRRDRLRAEVEALQDQLARLPATAEVANLARAVEDLSASMAVGGASARGVLTAARELIAVETPDDAEPAEVVYEVNRMIRERVKAEEEAAPRRPGRIEQ